MSEFLRPRLIGPRFEGGKIPLEMLEDLSVLRKMVIEVAKWRYLQTNPQRSRSPKGFSDSISFSLVDVENASATPVIHADFHAPLESALPQLTDMPRMYEQYFAEARDAIIDAISAAQHNQSPSEYLPPKYLAHFDRLGRRLRDHESIEFTSPNRTSPATLTKDIRRTLILASDFPEVTEEVHLRGYVPEADQDRMSFELQVIGGRKIQSAMTEDHLGVVLEVFNGYPDHGKALISGIGKYDRRGYLVGIDTIDEIAPLDPLDVPSRLLEIRQLKDGWLDGQGRAPDDEALDWLSKRFDSLYPDELPLPYVYPTPEGGVQAEWSFGDHELSVDIDFETWIAELHIISIDTSDEESDSIDLYNDSDWIRLADRIRFLSDVSV